MLHVGRNRHSKNSGLSANKFITFKPQEKYLSHHFDCENLNVSPTVKKKSSLDFRVSESNIH